MRKIIKNSVAILAVSIAAIGTYYYQQQDNLIFRSKVLPRDYIFKFKIPFEELYIPVGDGEEINAVYFPVKNPKGVILYLHGSGHDMRKYGKRASQYTKYGYDLLMIDYRGYGKSTSDGFSEKKFHEDSQAAYEYLQKKYPEDQILVYGQSLGTHMATWVAANNTPKMLLLEAPFYSMVKAAAHTKPFLPEWFVKLILKHHMRTDQYIQDVESPIVIFHGTDDDIVPYAQGQRLFAELKHKKDVRLHTFPKWGHDFFHDLPKYHDHLAELL